MMALELFFAKSYPAPPYGPGAEVALAMAGNWSPASQDFAATATRSGGGTGVGTLDDILAAIGKKSVGSLDELGIIAHAHASFFALAGTVLTSGPHLPDVTFARGSLVDAAGLQGKQAPIDAVKGRFARGAPIVRYGCHAGLDDALLQALARAFGVCVYGFAHAVAYLLEWNLSSQVVLARGKTFLDASGMVAAGLATPGSVARNDIHQLTPDKQSSASCPGYQTKTAATTSAAGASGGSGGGPK
jgi:hypothetical protein